MLTIQNKIHCQYEELPALIKKQKEDACFVVSGRFRKCPEELLKEYYAECFDVPQDFVLEEDDLSEISDAIVHSQQNIKIELDLSKVTGVNRITGFLMLPQLVGIELPECIVSILSYAFYDCSNLFYIGIPEGCESIQEDAFTDLPSLRELKIPDSVKNVSPKMLTGCFNLEKLECSVLDCVDGFIISEGGTRLVRYYRNKEIINIPSGIKIIEEKAFYNSSIEKVVMPEGLKKIMPSAFSYCRNLKNADIPTSVDEIGEDAFYCCESLERINIPVGIKKISERTFLNCISLKEIYIPDTVQEIGQQAFYECDSLSKVRLPSGLKTVYDESFGCCKSLENLKFSSDINVLQQMSVLTQREIDELLKMVESEV